MGIKISKREQLEWMANEYKRLQDEKYPLVSVDYFMRNCVPKLFNSIDKSLLERNEDGHR
jgi:hypothetical protein